MDIQKLAPVRAERSKTRAKRDEIVSRFEDIPATTTLYEHCSGTTALSLILALPIVVNVIAIVAIPRLNLGPTTISCYRAS